VEPALPEDAPSIIASSCEHYACAMRFVESLPGVKPFLNWTDYGRCFCDCGHWKKDGDVLYPKRGDTVACKACQTHFKGGSAKCNTCANKCSTYAIPHGWHRFAVTSGSNSATGLKLWEPYHRKFHGTHVDSVAAILASGVLAKPGDTLVREGGDVMRLAERPGHIHGSFKRTNKHTGKPRSLIRTRSSSRRRSAMHRTSSTQSPRPGPTTMAANTLPRSCSICSCSLARTQSGTQQQGLPAIPR